MSSQKRPLKSDRDARHSYISTPCTQYRHDGRYRSPLTGLRLIKKGPQATCPLVSCLAKSSATNYVYPQWEANPAQRLAGIVGPTLFTHAIARSEEHTSGLQSHSDLVCRLLPAK